MRILQVTPFFHPHAGGVESHVRAISRELARQGHQVTVLTSRHDRRLPKTESLDGFEIRRAASRGVVFNTPLDSGIARAIAGIPADVVHLHYPPPLTSYFAIRGLKNRTVPTCLTYHCDLYLPGISGRILTGIYQSVFLPRTLSRVRRIIVHTASYGRTSAPLRGRELMVIPSVVDVARFRPDVDGSAIRQRLGIDGGRVIAFTGRLVPHKGVDEIVRALPQLPSDVKAIIVGRGPRLPSLIGLARRLNVEDRIRFCPEVDDDELPQYLRAADVFVFPSQNRLEGFGLVVAEAMASGLPVVIADMPGVREIIDPGVQGLLVEPLVGADLVARVDELLADPARRAAMGRAGRARAEERYALSRVTKQLISMYEGLTAAG